MTASIATLRAAAPVPERPPRPAIPLPMGAETPSCPQCGGRMWDNRTSKRNPKAPDFKCRNRACDGVRWPGQHGTVGPPPPASPVSTPQARAQHGAADRIGDSPVDGMPNATPNAEAPADPRRPLRETYITLTAFVLQAVRPTYEACGLDCGADTVAAIVATLYIAETRREGR